MRIRPQTQPIGIVSGIKGSKTTFADDSGEDAGLADAPQAGPSRLSNAEPSFAQDDEDDSDDDDDDAPEAVGLAQGKQSRVEEEQREAELADRKRQAARARSDKIAALKARQKEEAEAMASKGKRKVKAQESDEDEDEDEATRRLRKRMEAAMADGEDESDEDMSDEGSEDDEEEGEDEDEDENEGDEEEEETDEEEEDEEEEEDDDESDYSETLQEGPLTDTERQMRERMQAAMEAAEARAGLAPKKSKSALKQTNLTTAASAQETPDIEEESFDLTPYHSTVKPLPQHVLDAAARAQAEKKAAQALAHSAKPNDRELKRKRQRQKAIVRPPPSSRALSDNKILHLLPTVLDTNSPLPPVIKPGALRPTGPRNTFIKTAMKKSGVGVPGRGLVDGRRKGISSAR